MANLFNTPALMGKPFGISAFYIVQASYQGKDVFLPRQWSFPGDGSIQTLF